MECSMKYAIGKNGHLIQLKKEFDNGKTILTRMQENVRVTFIIDNSDKENVERINFSTKGMEEAANISRNMDVMDKYFCQAVPNHKYKTRTGIIYVTIKNQREDATFRCESFSRTARRQLMMTAKKDEDSFHDGHAIPLDQSMMDLSSSIDSASSEDVDMQQFRQEIDDLFSATLSNEDAVMLSPSTLDPALRDVQAPPLDQVTMDLLSSDQNQNYAPDNHMLL